MTDPPVPVGAGRVDLHSHLVPAVDDGSQSARESADALAAFASQGVTALVTTPHVELSLAMSGRMDARLSEIDDGWLRLEEVARGTGIAVHRGAELRLDAAASDLSDPRLRLAGTRFALVEFAWFTVPPRSAHMLLAIVRAGWVPIVAHPERYDGLDAELEIVREWRETGAYIQVNGGALLGRYGVSARSIARRLLARGWVDYMSSDYHARGRLRIDEYHAAVSAMNGTAQADLLVATNPARVLRDERPLPVPPVPHALEET